MIATSNKIQLNPLHRVVMLTMVITQTLLFLWANALISHYTMFPIPFLNYPSMITAPPGQPHLLLNAALLILFWLQHIVMATLKYKLTWLQQWKYFPLYDRYIYNISSGLALWFIFAHIQPTDHLVFSLPVWLCLPIALIGTAMVVVAMWELGGHILMPYPITDILNSKFISYPSYGRKDEQGLKSDGAYAYTRNPMQAGALLMVLFANHNYTLDRLIFIAIMTTGIVIGVLMQEKRMQAQFKDFGRYKQQVKSRFIPYLF